MVRCTRSPFPSSSFSRVSDSPTCLRPGTARSPLAGPSSAASFHVPSIWYDDVPVPQKKSSGNFGIDISVSRRTANWSVTFFTCPRRQTTTLGNARVGTFQTVTYELRQEPAVFQSGRCPSRVRFSPSAGQCPMEPTSIGKGTNVPKNAICGSEHQRFQKAQSSKPPGVALKNSFNFDLGVGCPKITTSPAIDGRKEPLGCSRLIGVNSLSRKLG